MLDYRYMHYAFLVWLVAVLFAYVLPYYVVNIERYPSRQQNFDH